jgi:putative ABC transport system permease protein
MIKTLWYDIRYAIRTLLKKPGFAFTTIIVLALGIGGNTAIFSVVNAVLLRSLPYAEADRILMVWENDAQEGNPKNSVAPGNFVDFRDQNQVFEQLGFYTQPAAINLTGSDESERVQEARASASLFHVLGVQAERGRLFLPEDDKPGAPTLAVITHGLWQRRFGGSPDAVNGQLLLDGNPITIVGVLPPEFELPEKAEVFTSLPLTSDHAANRKQHFMRGVGRLKPGATLEQARANLSGIAHQIEQQYPETNTKRGVTVIPIKEQFVGDVRLALLILFGAAGCVLLVVCTNVANLLLIRGAARHKEFAIRTALGATRWRVIRQLLVESVLLAICGGALGMLLALWATRLFIAAAPASVFPRGAEIGLSPSVLLFTAGVSVLTGIIFGLAPALQVSKPDVNIVLKEGGRGTSSGSRLNRIGRMLVVAEVALSLLLLVFAGLMIKSFMRIQKVDPGFKAENVLTMQISLPTNQYKENNQMAAFYRQLDERIQSLPGVQQSGLISRLSLAGDRATTSINIEGRQAAPGEELEAHYRIITPNYFRLIGVPLMKGREFGEEDAEKMPTVAIINESMARAYWPGQDPVGKRIRLGPNPNEPWTQVVGVVRDARNFGLDADARYEVYQSYLQAPPRRARIVVRTASDPLALIGAVKGEISALNKNLPVGEVTTMETLLADSVAQKRFSVLLLTAFAVVALLLAAVGIYGVISYGVSQRTHELGLRMALGAKPKHILNLIVGQGAKLALIGVGIGLVAALLLTRVLAGLLYGVSATDPTVFAGLAILLVGVALVACFIPARRATKIEPMIAMRYE